MTPRLVVVTGKGGVGKSTVAAALGTASARAGHRTVVCEVGEQGVVPRLLGVTPTHGSQVTAVGPRLWVTAVSPETALAEWFSRSLGRAGAALLTRSAVMDAFIAAAPGARELITIGKVWDLLDLGGDGTGGPVDVVVLDAPSTGHAVALLGAPATYSHMGGGTVRREAQELAGHLATAPPTAIVGVAEPAELPVSELLFLDQGLREHVGRGLTAIVVNRRMSARFTARDLSRIDAAAGGGRAARACGQYRRRCVRQDEQVARLAAELDLPRVELPLVAGEDLGPDEVVALGRVLAPQLPVLLVRDTAASRNPDP